MRTHDGARGRWTRAVLLAMPCGAMQQRQQLRRRARAHARFPLRGSEADVTLPLRDARVR